MPGPDAEVDVTAELVQVLLEAQHPDLAGLSLRRTAEGWDNVMFRLGADLAVRLPRRQMAAVLIEHEQRWLPQLGPRLPIPAPIPVRVGAPGPGYPWAWSVCPWLPGVDIEHAAPHDWDDTAERLAAFLTVLHRPAPRDAPVNPYRGVPLPARAAAFVQGLDALADQTLDRRRLGGLWEDALGVAPWSGPPLWLHGDLHPLNILVDCGGVSAVIDWGDLTAGDPASDLAVAWMLFPPALRERFRAAYAPGGRDDDDLWARARGWAIALGVALANGGDRVSAIGRRTLGVVLAEFA